MSIYSILDALDEEAATTYVEKSGGLKVEIVEKLHLVVSLLIEGRLTVAEADVLWPQWWAVISGFVVGYELEGLIESRGDIEGLADDDPEELAAADHMFLWTLRGGLESYLAHRASGKLARFGSATPPPENPVPITPGGCGRISPRLRRRR